MSMTRALFLAVFPLHALAATPLPAGWSLVQAGVGVSASAVDEGCGGLPGVALEATAPVSRRGTVVQVISAQAYRGRRLRLSGRVTSLGVQGRAGLWMRVDGGPRAELQAFDDMRDRALVGTSRCVPVSVVLDIPADADTLGIGAVLEGSGRLELSAVRLSPVGETVPSTDLLRRGLRRQADPLPPPSRPATRPDLAPGEDLGSGLAASPGRRGRYPLAISTLGYAARKPQPS